MHVAVARLTELVPPGRPRQVRDWASVERTLGTALPEDYKELVELYGGGAFDETIWLLDPECPDKDYNLTDQATERLEELTTLWQTEPKPAELHGKGSKILPWAYIEGSGAMLYWLVRPDQKPAEWTVMLHEGRGPEWERHSTQCAPFLLSVLTGDADTEYFPALPLDNHLFDSNDDILQ
ncbi:MULTISPECIES: SMI1/KNR4 family protein [unclassified Streptomyces]|uniref:SMI1/KNR4 family protein n=1 Tax=unclassified Streptomyces TaxID=2593676 RepID=UPI0022B6FDF6|nr:MULTISPECIES: SMI1/KNR4 family protein [unclassified Streptomyces]MCZ7416188.1 SMI1/KNR4 family protein [Streptomyces sp. WMMC897]MCZ7434003.1 SMI1/KNR4 family protein [Streptomyces sp. WMMC1477]